MNYVVINGKKSTLVKGLLIQALPPISKPLMRTSIEEIDGRDGDIVTKLGYSAYDKQMSVGLFGDFDIDEVISFFDSEGIIIFSNEPDKFYRFQTLEQIDFEKLLRFRTATVTFHVQPFKYSAVDDDILFTKDKMRFKYYTATQNGVTITCENGVISIKGTATKQTEFYVPIWAMYLSAGEYTLTSLLSGTGANGCQMRVIGETPTDADSFGGEAIPLGGDLTATLSASKTFNYIWFNLPTGAKNLTLVVGVIDEDFETCQVFNRGNIISRPFLTLYGTGDVTLSVNGEELFEIALDEYITIDAEKMNAYKGDTLANRSVVGDYSKLSFKIGTNTISWEGELSQIEVGNVSRWI